MNWKAPESEEAWAECLSAYLDGELPAGERQALEELLPKNTARAEQLEQLRRLSARLREWTIEVPDPDTRFLRQLRREADSAAAFALSGMHWQIAALAAVFLLGALAGGGGVWAFGRRAPRPVVIVYSPVSTPDMSDEQVQACLRQAASLVTEERTEGASASAMDWKEALEKWKARVKDRPAESAVEPRGGGGWLERLRRERDRLKEKSA